MHCKYLKGILLIHLFSSVPAPVHLKCVPDIGKLELHPEVCKDILIDYQQLLQVARSLLHEVLKKDLAIQDGDQ